jgi:hypothetical protein
MGVLHLVENFGTFVGLRNCKLKTHRVRPHTLSVRAGYAVGYSPAGRPFA